MPRSTVRTTLLAAHALPAEFAGRADDYIDYVCRDTIPAVAAARLADAVDAFCETIGFTPEQMRRRVRRGARARPAGEAACRPAVGLWTAPRSRRKPARFRRTISSTRTQPASRRWRLPARSRCCCPAPSTRCANRSCRRSPRCASAGVPMAIATDCNPGTSPVDLAAADAQHGVHAVPADTRRGAGRASPCTVRGRWDSPTGACSRRACAPTSPAGTSPSRPSSRTGSAATPRCGGAYGPAVSPIGAPDGIVRTACAGDDAVAHRRAARRNVRAAGPAGAAVTPAARAVPDTDWHVEKLYAFAARRRCHLAVRHALALRRRSQSRSVRRRTVRRRGQHRVVPDADLRRRSDLRVRSSRRRQRRLRNASRTYFAPYHAALTAEIERRACAARLRDRARRAFDSREVPRFFDGRLPDLNLGTADGASCAPALQARAAAVLAGAPRLDARS